MIKMCQETEPTKWKNNSANFINHQSNKNWIERETYEALLLAMFDF